MALDRRYPGPGSDRCDGLLAGYRVRAPGNGGRRVLRHLPHDSLLNYFVSKARAGIRDSWNQLTMDHDQIDWEAMRGRWAEFVYDSGCLHCHKEFKNGKGPEHPAYFAGGTNPSFERPERASRLG